MKKEYRHIFDLFEEYLQDIAEEETRGEAEEVLYEMMDTRANNLIRYALESFGLTAEQAISIINDPDGNEELQKILEAAIDNLADFGAAEEYQMIVELEEVEEEDAEAWLAIAYGICKKYNLTYANVENLDTIYAMAMAYKLHSMKSDTALVYCTQGDERVRPWHRVYEGYTAPKHSFPSWLIPPIEHNCRCFLDEVAITGSVPDVMAKTKEPEKPDWLSGVFKESVSQGGRIFSDEHRYFTIKKEDVKWLEKMAKRVKDKFYGNGKDNDV